LKEYAPRGIRHQDRPLKRLIDERDRNTPAVACFPESDMMKIMMMRNMAKECKFCLFILVWFFTMTQIYVVGPGFTSPLKEVVVRTLIAIKSVILRRV
jgi:hypothetical protein